MNTYTAVVNLCKDPEPLKLGEKELMKLRLADNTFGKNAETRFLDALVAGQDKDVAEQLKSGDQIVISGTLVKGSYTAKKNGKGVKRGQKIMTDSIPFARIVQVTKSESFFNGAGDEGGDGGDGTETEVGDETAADEGADENPLADIV